MGRLFTGIFVLTAATAAIAMAAPAGAVPTPAASPQQVYLQETQQVTGRAQVVFKGDDSDATAVEGRAELVEYSQGLVYKSASGPADDLRAVPASPVHTTTTATVSWKPAKTLPKPRNF